MTTPSIAQQQVTQLLGVIAADSFPARARSLAYKAFTVVFYGSKIFDRKTAQLSETLRNQVTWSQPLKTDCATWRKPAQNLSLELQTSCSTN